MFRYSAAMIVTLLAGPALADAHGAGDAAKGEKGFNKCRACHEIVSDTGDVIVKGGKTGPNLWGVAGRQAGSVEGFNYGPDIVSAGAAGLVFDPASFVAFTADPREFLRGFLSNPKAAAKMTFKLKSGGEDIYAYLVSVGPK